MQGIDRNVIRKEFLSKAALPCTFDPATAQTVKPVSQPIKHGAASLIACCRRDVPDMFHQQRQTKAPGMDSFTDKVRRVLQVMALKDPCNAAAVASHFAMHRRSLHRHLNAEGRTFRQVDAEVRFGLACGLMAYTQMTLAQIASAVGYSELSAFTRAFRRWFGQPPSAWRGDQGSGRKRSRTPAKRPGRLTGHFRRPSTREDGNALVRSR
jgi:AraC-like DNA-binding protein